MNPGDCPTRAARKRASRARKAAERWERYERERQKRDEEMARLWAGWTGAQKTPRQCGPGGASKKPDPNPKHWRDRAEHTAPPAAAATRKADEVTPEDKRALRRITAQAVRGYLVGMAVAVAALVLCVTCSPPRAHAQTTQPTRIVKVLAPGADFGAAADALPAGAVLQLERGKTYKASTTGNVNRAGQAILAVGDPDAPPALVQCTAQPLDCNGATGLRVQGVRFDGTGTKVRGLRLLNLRDAEFRDVHVTAFGGMGITCQGYGTDSTGKPRRASGVRFVACVVADNWPSLGEHTSGLYAANTDGLVIQDSLLDQNGHRPGVKPGTIYNHNLYVHASCGPVTFRDNVTARASSHGAQFRSGGTITGNVLLDNPIGASVGLVNGSAVYVAPDGRGGVTALVADNAFIGWGMINGSTRGWALELSNARDVQVRDSIMAHCTGPYPALMVEPCRNISNPGKVLAPSSWSLRVGPGVYVWDWAAGASKVTAGAPVITMGPPAVLADLRVAIGPDFLARARKRPAGAAREAIAAMRTALDPDRAANEQRLAEIARDLALVAEAQAQLDKMAAALADARNAWLADQATVEQKRAALVAEQARIRALLGIN